MPVKYYDYYYINDIIAKFSPVVHAGGRLPY